MDPIMIMLIAKAVLVNTKNLLKEVDKAMSDDGKVSKNELPDIIFNTAIKSLDELGAGSFNGILGIK